MTPINQLRAGHADCPSDLALDRLHANECNAEESGRLEKHIAGCDACPARMEERRAGFNAIAEADPVRMLAAIRRGADKPAGVEQVLAWARRLLAPVAIVAAASIMLITRKPPEIATGQFKGAMALHVYRLAGEHAEEVSSGSPFSPGDRLRFAIDLPHDGTVRVLGVEANGTLYTAWPSDPREPTNRLAGPAVELPGAVELDQTVGRESLYGVWCPPPVDAVLCHSVGPGKAPECPASCKLSAFALEKRR